MARCCGCCAGGAGGCRTSTLVLLLITAIPFAYITSLEKSTRSISYLSDRWFHECAKWDPSSGRFLVSTFAGGGVAEVSAGGGEERLVLADPDVAGNMSVGISIDGKRRRLLVVYGDSLGFRYGAVGAYGMDSWNRLFLTRLCTKGDEPCLADDVAVDDEGNSYITDAKSNKIWKVGLNGELLSIIRSKIFVQREGFLHNFIGLNGIAYHPNGYLLVIHTSGGNLFKINVKTEEISLVKVEGSLARGDGLELISPNKLVAAGTPSRVVKSSDDWVTAKVTGRYVGPIHRIPTSATVKDGKVYLNHLVGFGLNKRTHLLAEAVFTPLGDN